MIVEALHTDFHLGLAGKLIDITEIELEIRRSSRTLQVKDRAIEGHLDCLDGPPTEVEAASEDERLRFEELSALELRSKLERNKAEKTDHLSHLCDFYDEVVGSSMGYFYFPADRSILLDHYQHLISWLQDNRRCFIRLTDQRTVLEKERALELTKEREVDNPSSTAVDNSLQLTDLEKRVKDLWQLPFKFRGSTTRGSQSRESAFSGLSVLQKTLQDIRQIKKQSIDFRKYSSPVVVQARNDDLSSCLSKIQSGLQELQTACLACDAEILVIKEGFKDALATSSPQPSMLPIDIIQSEIESALNTTVREAFESAKNECITRILTDFPSGNKNPNQQYAWKLLQKTFDIVDRETNTMAFKRSDPDLSGPLYAALY
ncbi:hypothetical protein CPB84DRAFT_40630 [Gymnopilus junonius]|uniref:Uncharacterized protein n=1 Tax=Gymnopilus junonius TaxID=109634 RepID=A0A9P5TV33_GYMJU|nr:hypothetical protein CPB84DRAFT_40630 [Gymnopilus junonius]